ncbi:hypothetical protein LTR08_004255 [Meristemomyces frigidus]|nr:hypothetical protein LTR08_004255 [Meristemomyces frigidus]
MPPRITLPPLTRALLLALLALSTLNAILRTRMWTTLAQSQPPPPTASKLVATAANYLSSPSLAVPYLVLVPITSLRYPWTFLSAALVENNVVSLAISGGVLWVGGRYLERAWGSKGFAKFVFFVTVIPNILTFSFYATWHIITPTPEFPTPIQGLLALSASFLVALKQLTPDHTVSLFKGAIKLRIKHLPALFTLANIISGPLLGTETAFWLSLLGFFTSWIYLRFYRATDINASSAATGGQGATMTGDPSDAFSFASFFPDAFHPFLSPVCDAIYSALVQMKLCAPFSPESVEAGNARSRSEGLPSLLNGGGGGGRRAEAERRRALALKALDQRLNAAAAATGPGSGPGGASASASATTEERTAEDVVAAQGVQAT